MRKNALIISSSPREGGNSDTLCNQFMKGAKAVDCENAGCGCDGKKHFLT